MTITSLSFLLLFLILFVLYYSVPKRLQWIILLAGSLFFYVCSGIKNALYIVITETTVYFATCGMQMISLREKEYLEKRKEKLTKEEKATVKRKTKRTRKTVMVLTLLLNLTILCFFKYYGFVLDQVNAVRVMFDADVLPNYRSFIIPLGISFYTFQSIGYLVDVYWGRCKAEKNVFKVVLFISFFPQITQGPISDYESLSKELFSEHIFSYQNFSRGGQRVIWGLAKKLLLADLFGTYVQDAFSNYTVYSGATLLLGALMYSVQIYADFSGYMDIVCGLCEMLGIHLTENFDRPYFSKSVAEYWRRWHITLGAWFKKYIYYPIGVSSWNRNLTKKARKRFGKRFSESLSPTVALLVTWLATGLWHGASWTYIAWGLINGFFIILSIWMDPVYDSWKSRLHIRQNTWLWRAFQTLRTFLLVTMIKVFPEVGSFDDGVGFLKRIFTHLRLPSSFSGLLPFVQQKLPFFLACVLLLLLFCFSLIQRRCSVRTLFQHLPAPVRIVILAGVIVLIGIFADLSAGGFMYARF